MSVIEAPRETEAPELDPNWPVIEEPEVVATPAPEPPEEWELPEKFDELLVRSANILEQYGWCQGDMARDEDGCEVEIDDPEAVRFCALGALGRACFDYGIYPDDYIENSLARVLSRALDRNMNEAADVASWNDSYDTNQQDVVGALRKAAETCCR